MNQKKTEGINEYTEIWVPTLDIVLPIDGSDIEGFRDWINWNGWKGYEPDHTAYDFAAYLTQDGKCVLGLSKETPVRAIADGVVKQVEYGLGLSHNYEGKSYSTIMGIEHGREGSGLLSTYVHIDPIAHIGQKVKKGDIIATLYTDKGNEEGKLVHLHFELIHGRDVSERECNPELIYPSLGKYKGEPQGSTNFQVSGLPTQPKIHVANFKKLLEPPFYS